MIDPHSATWGAVKAHALAEIENARVRLETPGLGLADTEAERGAIIALRNLLKLADPRQAVIPSTNYNL